MRKADDGIVEAADLLDAIEEIKRGLRPQMMKRLEETEPRLATYIEAAAEHVAATITGRTGSGITAAVVKNELLDFTITVIRAQEISHYRTWRGLIGAASPLARLVNGEQTDNQNGAK